jgi:putative membrane protein
MSGGMMAETMVDGMTNGDGIPTMLQEGMAVMGQMIQGGMMDGGMMGSIMGPWMMVVPLLVLIGLGFLAVWGIRKLGSNSGDSRSAEDALKIARERYARGEIDEEQFRTIRSDLASR